jgi:hypothetical protein
MLQQCLPLLCSMTCTQVYFSSVCCRHCSVQPDCLRCLLPALHLGPTGNSKRLLTAAFPVHSPTPAAAEQPDSMAGAAFVRRRRQRCRQRQHAAGAAAGPHKAAAGECCGCRRLGPVLHDPCVHCTCNMLEQLLCALACVAVRWCTTTPSLFAAAVAARESAYAVGACAHDSGLLCLCASRQSTHMWYRKHEVYLSAWSCLCCCAVVAGGASVPYVRSVTTHV